MGTQYALILACDLLPDGSDIGPITIQRLQTGLDHCVKTGDTPVLAAAYSPRHPHQQQAMSFMMEDWLWEFGRCDCRVLIADTFNTRGELTSVNSLEMDKLTIISGALHLHRVQILVERMQRKGLLKKIDVVYVPTSTEAMTERGNKLEGIKKLFVRYVPFWLQDWVIFLLHKTPLRHINLSY